VARDETVQAEHLKKLLERLNAAPDRAGFPRSNLR